MVGGQTNYLTPYPGIPVWDPLASNVTNSACQSMLALPSSACLCHLCPLFLSTSSPSKLPFFSPQHFCLYHLLICSPPLAVTTKCAPFLTFAPCANSLCSSMQDSGPCSGPGPTGDAVVTLYRILLLIFRMFHLFSFILDLPLLLLAVSLIHYPSDNEHHRSFQLCSSCSALETHSFPSSKLITKRLHMMPCHV